MGRGRPCDGVEGKRNTNVTLTPSVWSAFRELVKTKLHLSASSHLETLIKQEVKRLRGEETPAVDVEALQKRYDACVKKMRTIGNDLEKWVKDETITKLVDAYNMDFDSFSNISEAIGKMLTDQLQGDEETPVHMFLELADEADLSLLITYLELRVQTHTLRKRMMEAHRAKYLGAITPIEA